MLKVINFFKIVVFVLFLILISGCKLFNQPTKTTDSSKSVIDPRLYQLPKLSDQISIDDQDHSDQPVDIAQSYFNFLLGMQHILEGSYEEAIVALSKNHHSNNDPISTIHLIKALILTGKIKSAEQLAHKSTLLYPYSEEILLTYGKILLSQNKSSQSRELFKRAMLLSSTPSQQAYLALINSYLKNTPDYKQALKIAKKLIKSYPYSIEGLSILSRLYIKLEKYKHALLSANKGIDIDPEVPELIMIKAYALAKLNKSNQAQKQFSNLHQTLSYSLEGITQVVTHYEHFHGIDDALATLTKLSIASKLPYSFSADQLSIDKEVVIILIFKKKFIEALNLIDKLDKQNLIDDQLLFLQGVCYLSLDHYNHAVEAFLKIPSSSKLSVNGSITAANILIKQQKNHQAISAVEKLLANSQSTADLYYQASMFYHHIGLVDASLSVLSTALYFYPDQNIFTSLKASIYYDSKQYSKLVNILTEFLKNHPEDHQALNTLGYYYIEKKIRLKYAQKLIVKALRQEPLNPAYIDSLGWYFYQTQDYSKALEWISLAHQLQPSDPTITEHLGYVYLKNEQCIQALHYFNIAFGLAKNHQKQHINDTISELKKTMPDC